MNGPRRVVGVAARLVARERQRRKADLLAICDALGVTPNEHLGADDLFATAILAARELRDAAARG